MVKPKICIIIGNYKAPWAEAIKNNTREIINQLSEKYDIFCIGPSTNTSKKIIDGKITSYLIKSPLYLTKFKRVFYPFGIINLIIKGKKIIKEEQPDIIISNLESPSVGFVGSKLKKYAKENTKFIQIVNAEYYSYNKTPLKYWFLDDLPHLLFNNKTFFKAGLKKADKNIIITKLLLEKIKQMGIENVVYIPYGVNLKKFKKTNLKKQKEFTVGYLGHLIYAKGAGLLLDAFIELSKKHNLRLNLATTWGSEEDKLKNINNSKIINFGTLKNPESFYNSCNLFILPLRMPFATLNLPQVLLEAQACETPVLASDLDNIKELIVDKKTGFLFERNNKRDLMNKIIQIYKNQENLENIAENALKNIKSSYDLLKTVNQVDSLIKELLK